MMRVLMSRGHCIKTVGLLSMHYELMEVSVLQNIKDKKILMAENRLTGDTMMI